MSSSLVVAAVLAVLIAIVHSSLGERYILVRLLRRENLPKLFGGVEFTKNTLRFAWHLTSVAWCGLAAVLVVLAGSEGVSAPRLARVVSITFGVTALLALVGSKGRHLSWIVFLAIALLTWS